MSAQPVDLHWVQRPGIRLGAVHRPRTVLDALVLLQANPQLRPVAGGTDLVLELARSGAGTGAALDAAGAGAAGGWPRAELLDTTTIAGLDVLQVASIGADTPTSIGAAVTHADILASSEAVERLLPLAQACLEIGSPQLRNRATIVGNLVTASPANDTISALLALDASVVIASLGPASGARSEPQVVERTVPLAEFHPGFRATVLQPGELVVRVTVPAAGPNQRGIWVKAGLRKAQAISVVHAGLVLDFDADPEASADAVVTSARVALGSVAPTVTLCEPVAAALVGSRLNEQTIATAADAAAAAVAPIDDVRATADYRVESVRVIVRRALDALAAGAERDRWPTRVPLLAVQPDGAGDGETAAGGAGGRNAGESSKPDLVRSVSAMVNGSVRTAPPSGSGTLLDWLRETAGTGTKEGCAEGECGACTVNFDGKAVMSCLIPAGQADGATIETIEALGNDTDPHPLQHAFVERFAVQCGYCIPGFVMAAERLTAELAATDAGARPTRADLELALSGNLCRCTGYYNIIDAVMAAIDTAPGGAR